MDHQQILERMKFLNVLDVYLQTLIETHIHRYIANRQQAGYQTFDNGKLFYICMELMPQLMAIYKTPNLTEEQCRFHLEWLMDEITTITEPDAQLHNVNKEHLYPEGRMLFVPGAMIDPTDIEFHAAGWEVVKRAHKAAFEHWEDKKIDYISELNQKYINSQKRDYDYENQQYSQEQILEAVENAHKGYSTGGYCG